MLLIAAVAERLHGASAVAVNAVLVVMIVGNILGWPAYRRVMLASKWLPGVHAQSALLKQSFEQQRPADDLTPDYRALYDLLQSSTRRSRSALAMTETELNVIAALAIIGLRGSPNHGYSSPAAMGTPARLCR